MFWGKWVCTAANYQQINISVGWGNGIYAHRRDGVGRREKNEGGRRREGNLVAMSSTMICLQYWWERWPSNTHHNTIGWDMPTNEHQTFYRNQTHLISHHQETQQHSVILEHSFSINTNCHSKMYNQSKSLKSNYSGRPWVQHSPTKNGIRLSL